VVEDESFCARVQYARVLEMDDVVDQIVRQGSTVTRTDILGVLEGYCTAIETFLLQGFKINTPLARYGVSVKGVFEQGDSAFDPTRHRVVSTMRPGQRLQAAIGQNGQVIRKTKRAALPRLLRYVDAATGEQNGTVTPGGMGQVAGHWLRFDPTDPAQGIFFVGDDGSETQVPAVGYVKPSLLMLVVPAGLAPGDYRLEVRVVVESDLRSGALDAVPTV
jgi:hypothetical protein